MSRINKKAELLLQKALQSMRLEMATFYTDNPVMLKILHERETITLYLLKLCSKERDSICPRKPKHSNPAINFKSHGQTPHASTAGLTSSKPSRLALTESIGYFVSCREDLPNKQSSITICQSRDFSSFGPGDPFTPNNIAFSQSIPTTSIINIRRFK